MFVPMGMCHVHLGLHFVGCVCLLEQYILCPDYMYHHLASRAVAFALRRQHFPWYTALRQQPALRLYDCSSIVAECLLFTCSLHHTLH